MQSIAESFILTDFVSCCQGAAAVCHSATRWRRGQGYDLSWNTRHARLFGAEEEHVRIWIGPVQDIRALREGLEELRPTRAHG